MQSQPARADLRVVRPADADWEAVYRDHVVPIYRYVYARVGNRPDAEDITSAVFVKALPRLQAGVSSGEVRAYLLTTARTCLADHWRRHYDVDIDDVPDEMLASPEEDDTPDDGSRRRRAHAILERLPEHYRRVLELRFLRGYSIRETAHEMSLSIANIKTLQLRALRRAATLEPEPAE